MLATLLATAALTFSSSTVATDGRDAALSAARILLEARDYAGAIACLEGVIEKPAGDGLDVQFMLGLAYFGSGDYEAARGPFERLANAEPGDALPWEFLGRLEFQLGQLGRAAECLQTAAGIDPQDGRTHNHLGAVLVRMNRNEEAIDAFRTSLSYDPSFSVAHYNIGVLSVLDDDVLSGVYHLREAARLDVLDADPPRALGDLYRQLDRLDDAADWYQEASRRAPDDAAHQMALGEIHDRVGHRLEAEIAFTTACEIANEDDVPFVRLARFHVRGMRLDLATRSFESALLRDPKSRAAHKGLADLAEDEGDDARARHHLSALVDDGIRHPEILRRLVLVCERLHAEDGARDAFQLLVLTNDGDDDFLRAIAECMATSRIDGIRDLERGFQLAAALVERSGEQSAAALYVLSRAAAAQGDGDDAARRLEQAAALFVEKGPEAVVLRRLSARARGK